MGTCFVVQTCFLSTHLKGNRESVALQWPWIVTFSECIPSLGQIKRMDIGKNIKNGGLEKLLFVFFFHWLHQIEDDEKPTVGMVDIVICVVYTINSSQVTFQISAICGSLAAPPNRRWPNAKPHTAEDAASLTTSSSETPLLTKYLGLKPV
jgi:hypothetical protein